MNRKIFSLTVIFCLLATAGFAQANLLNAKTTEEIGKRTAAQDSLDNDKPLPYGYVGDRDILFGKKIWEVIDLNQRINFPLYYPVEKNLGNDRKPLYDVLITAVRDGRIAQVFSDEYFNTKQTVKDIESRLVRVDTSDAGIEEMNSNLKAYRSGKMKINPEFITRTEIEADAVSAYKVLGLWYFDKRQGELKYRMLAICPLVPDVTTLGSGDKNEPPIELFWVYFPAARDILHKSKAFNDKNSAIPIDFDHLLNARRFSAVVIKEENVYADRAINDYLKDNSQMQLLESERVRDKIRNFEQDMWNY